MNYGTALPTAIRNKYSSIRICCTFIIIFTLTPILGCEFIEAYKKGKQSARYWSILWDLKDWAIAFEKYYKAIDQGNAEERKKYEKVWEALTIEAEIFAGMTFLPDRYVEELIGQHKDYQVVLEECLDFTVQELTPFLRRALTQDKRNAMKAKIQRRLDFFKIRPALY